MKKNLKFMTFMVVAVFSLSLFGGCATAPLGPTVNVMPAPGKPLDLYQREVRECKEWAYQQMGGKEAVERAQNEAVTHGVVGTLLGAGAGAAIGAGAGNAASGAAIGAGAGLAAGSASGAASSARSTAELQLLYNNAYSQCMYARGNQVPGMQAPSYGPPPGYGPPQ